MLVPFFLQSSDELENIFGLKDVGEVNCETLDGQICHTLVGTFQDANDTKIWITDDYLLRKLRRSNIMTVDLQRKLLADAAKVVPEIASFSPISEFGTTVEYNYTQINMQRG
jgi:hypothetical protein